MEVLNIGGMNDFEEASYTCVCGQRNWRGHSCVKCGRSDPDMSKYNYPV